MRKGKYGYGLIFLKHSKLLGRAEQLRRGVRALAWEYTRDPDDLVWFQETWHRIDRSECPRADPCSPASPRRTFRIHVCTERHPCPDRGAERGSRLDEKVTIYQFHPLLHAGETKSWAVSCGLGIEARAGIADGQMNFIRRSPQVHVDQVHSAVLRGIAQGFLKNPEQGKRDFLGEQLAGHIMTSKSDLHSLLVSEFLAETSHGRNHAQILEFRRVQLVRQSLDIH